MQLLCANTWSLLQPESNREQVSCLQEGTLQGAHKRLTTPLAADVGDPTIIEVRQSVLGNSI